MYEEIPDLNIFMMCEQLNRQALSETPPGYHIRPCKRDEFETWAAFPFDSEEEARKHYGYMQNYFDTVYADREELFYQKCMLVCDHNDFPVATCFLWRAYRQINTIHWLKTLKGYEGLGIGRALLSFLMKDLQVCDFPVYLHTQPASFRAIKLYSDFGFKILTDDKYGNRTNDYKECMPILKKYMPAEHFERLEYASAPQHFIRVTNASSISEF